MPIETHSFGQLVVPEDGPNPGIVLIPDVWGLSDHYAQVAGRLAEVGFAVLVVDPYRKTGDRGEFSDPAGAMAFIRQLSDPLVIETIQEGIDALAAHPAVAGRKLGVVGFCMGGMYALHAAGSCSGLSAAVAFYGMIRNEAGLDPEKKPRAPIDALADLSCPLLGLYGEEDALIPVQDVRDLEAALSGSSHGGAVHIYPGAGHAFFNDTREQLYRPQQAAEAWSELVPFLRECLG
ncbi:MAG: dienelactone hydrolase family protein [bacterium]|nr:dienelactone hydrolase family protein [bacterium]MCP5065221.1 dienelactone hydrolase family protein [bacterium]